MAPLEPPRERFRLAVWSLNNLCASGRQLPARGFAALALLYDLPLLLSSAVAQPLAALLPYGCGTPLAGAALASERKCSVISCYRWHNIAASAAKPPRQTIASLYKSKVGGNCVRLTNRRQSDSEDRSKPSRLIRKIAGTRFRRLRSSSSCSLAMQTFLSGDQKGDTLFREREYPPFTRVPHTVWGLSIVSLRETIRTQTR